MSSNAFFVPLLSPSYTLLTKTLNFDFFCFAQRKFEFSYVLKYESKLVRNNINRFSQLLSKRLFSPSFYQNDEQIRCNENNSYIRKQVATLGSKTRLFWLHIAHVCTESIILKVMVVGCSTII